jgi:hypothetical protein
MTADADGRLVSPELGLHLAIDEHLLRLIDPATGLPLPTDEEKDEELRRVTGEADEARREADEARHEADLERQRSAMLQAELARLRASRPSEES